MQLEDVIRGYGRTAPGYDRRLRFWFGTVLRIAKYRERAIERLGLLEGARVLDIGCGTGANLPWLVPQVGQTGQVVGLDYTPAMLERASTRVESNGWSNVELAQGDAVSLDAVQGSFDAILSTYCFGLLYDLEQAMNRAIDRLRASATRNQKTQAAMQEAVAEALGHQESQEPCEEILADERRLPVCWLRARSEEHTSELQSH